MRKPAFEVTNQVRHKPACADKEDGLRLEIYVLTNLAKNKDTDQLRGYSPGLICTFVFAYVKSRFTHDPTHKIDNVQQCVH